MHLRLIKPLRSLGSPLHLLVNRQETRASPPAPRAWSRHPYSTKSRAHHKYHRVCTSQRTQNLAFQSQSSSLASPRTHPRYLSALTRRFVSPCHCEYRCTAETEPRVSPPRTTPMRPRTPRVRGTERPSRARTHASPLTLASRAHVGACGAHERPRARKPTGLGYNFRAAYPLSTRLMSHRRCPIGRTSLGATTTGRDTALTDAAR